MFYAYIIASDRLIHTLATVQFRPGGKAVILELLRYLIWNFRPPTVDFTKISFNLSHHLCQFGFFQEYCGMIRTQRYIHPSLQVHEGTKTRTMAVVVRVATAHRQNRKQLRVGRVNLELDPTRFRRLGSID